MKRITNADRIIDVLRERGALDDDDLSLASGVKPRQQVNQICRYLESRKILRREVGPRGKIVNILIDARS